MPITKSERIARKLGHIKQERLQVQNGTPAVSDMKEGVPELRSTIEGLVEYTVYKGQLYKNVLKNVSVEDGDIKMNENRKIYFDTEDTYIYANTDNPEDLVIGANQDIILEPDNNVGIGIDVPVARLHVDATATAYDATTGLAIFQDNSNRQVVIGGLGLFRRDYNANADLRMNYLGYNGGTTQFRDLSIYDGKSALRFKLDGSNGDTYTNDGSVSSLSDVRVKKDIEDLSDGLSLVNQLRPRTFKYNDKNEMGTMNDRTMYGFIADEVLEVAPQYVTIDTGVVGFDDDGDKIYVDDFKSLSTGRMVPMLVNAIQELLERVEVLENV